MRSRLVALVITVVFGVAVGVAQETGSGPKARGGNLAALKVTEAADTRWTDAAAGLPKGAQTVLLDGHPGKEGPFTIRLKMPAGYKIPPHTHTTPERITVISGIARVGIGEKFEGSAERELNAGDFAVIPAGVPHFASSTSEAVLQIHSEGPFQRKYVDPAQ